jgi:1-aminocyclopropane-1-carboxylate deaminase
VPIAEMIKRNAPETRRIVVAVGTGTTLAGIVSGLSKNYEVLGVSALKGADDLEHRVDELLKGITAETHARWSLLHDYHCGGFARAHPRLREFILEFERIHRIPLDPVYTAKMVYAIAEQQRCGAWDARLPLLAIHTGGLQGRRGFPWLRCSA